jgi:hypothetical protein
MGQLTSWLAVGSGMGEWNLSMLKALFKRLFSVEGSLKTILEVELDKAERYYGFE